MVLIEDLAGCRRWSCLDDDAPRIIGELGEAGDFRGMVPQRVWWAGINREQK